MTDDRRQPQTFKKEINWEKESEWDIPTNLQIGADFGRWECAPLDVQPIFQEFEKADGEQGGAPKREKYNKPPSQGATWQL